jgi:hypothetical protein
MSWGKPVVRRTPKATPRETPKETPTLPVVECPPLNLKWVCVGGNPLCEFQNKDLTCRWQGDCRHRERVMVLESQEAEP